MENNRNWLELPGDVMLMILMKLQQQEVLESAQFVCKMWYDICKDPSMWRSIRFKDLTNLHSFYSKERKSGLPMGRTAVVFDREKMVYDAVDRSAGGLIDLDIQPFMSDDFYSYVASRATKLKRLRLSRCWNLSPKTIIDLLEKLSSLEVLEIYEALDISIVRSCPSTITIFKLIEGNLLRWAWTYDEEAMTIAKTMPKLRHLQLIGNNLSNVGVMSILESCSHLQSLDLRGCFILKLDGDILKRLEKQIKHLRYPEDPIEEDDDNYPITILWW